MLGELTFATAFVAIVGVIICFVGISAFSRGLRYRAKGAVFSGVVQGVSHHTRKNDKGQLIQNYYLLQLRANDGKKTFVTQLKSPHQYEKGDTVRLTKNPRGEAVLYRDNGIRWYSGLLEMLIGAGIAAFPFLVKRVGDPYASFELAAVLILGGILTLEVYLRDRKRTYEELDAEVADILLYDVENQRRVLKTNTWYPLLRYTLNGSPREFLSESNSSIRSAYQIGKKLKVYRDAETGDVHEKKASPLLAVFAAGFWVLALIGIVSVL